MRKIYMASLQRSFLLFLISTAFIFIPQIGSAQALPELMYYKFNTPGATTANTANTPVGINPSPVMGLTIGGAGQFGAALIGNGGTNTTNNVNTGWPLNLGTGPWTIGMWLNNFPATASTTQYFFGSGGGVTFRCFTGGVAGDNALLLRGTGLTDVPVTAIGSAPVFIHFVHEVSPANVIKVYKNGVLTNTVTQSSVNITGTDFWVGAYSGTTTAFPSGCLMDEFRMYNRALDANEIASTWNVELGGPPQPCINPPVPGTVTATANPVCMGSNFSLYLAGGTAGTNQTYQWQSSTDNVNWTDIAGGTSSSLTTSQTENKYYRCNVTCGVTVTSASLLVSTTICYCPSIPTSAIDEEIFSVTVNGATNAYDCNTVAPGPGSILNRYSNFYPLGPLTTLIPGTSVSFTILEDECDGATYFNNGCAIWIDFNRNGSFTDPGEQVYVESAVTQSPRTITGTFTVPLTATAGFTGMRIIVAENNSGSQLQPCMSYTYGETEDYVLNIAPSTPCAGTPEAGTAISTKTNVCAGENFTISLAGNTIAAALTYQWQSSADNTNWTNINGATTPFYTINQTVSTYYRNMVTCTNGNAYDSSASVHVVVLSGPPVASISSNAGDSVCTGTSVTLTTVDCAGCTYAWSSGATSNSINVDAGGYYSVTVTNSCGNDNDSKEIVYKPVPSLSINATNFVCTGSSTQITANGADSYSWSPPAGLNVTTGPVVTASPAATTTYTVTGTIGGCSKDISITISVNAVPAAPAISASGGATTFCQGGSVTLTSTATADNQWYRDNVVIPGATNQTYNATTTGNYTAKVNSNNCLSNASAGIAVTVNTAPPQPMITQVGNTLQSSAATGNQWYLNGGSIAGATGATYTPNVSGQYSVQVTSSGCNSLVSTSVNFVITATNDPNLERKIVIAPNPVKDDLLIRYTGNSAKFSVILISMNGAVLHRSIFTTNHTIDMRKYSAGMYVVKIINERNGEKVQKMIMKQ